MLSQLIKRAAVEAVETQQPIIIVTGTVIQATPLLIQIDQKQPLDKDFFMFTDYSSKLELKAGTPLVLFKMQGGQRYLVLDKAVV